MDENKYLRCISYPRRGLFIVGHHYKYEMKAEKYVIYDEAGNEYIPRDEWDVKWKFEADEWSGDITKEISCFASYIKRDSESEIRIKVFSNGRIEYTFNTLEASKTTYYTIPLSSICKMLSVIDDYKHDIESLCKFSRDIEGDVEYSFSFNGKAFSIHDICFTAEEDFIKLKMEKDDDFLYRINRQNWVFYVVYDVFSFLIDTGIELDFGDEAFRNSIWFKEKNSERRCITEDIINYRYEEIEEIHYKLVQGGLMLNDSRQTWEYSFYRDGTIVRRKYRGYRKAFEDVDIFRVDKKIVNNLFYSVHFIINDDGFKRNNFGGYDCGSYDIAIYYSKEYSDKFSGSTFAGLDNAITRFLEMYWPINWDKSAEYMWEWWKAQEKILLNPDVKEKILKKHKVNNKSGYSREVQPVVTCVDPSENIGGNIQNIVFRYEEHPYVSELFKGKDWISAIVTIDNSGNCEYKVFEKISEYDKSFKIREHIKKTLTTEAFEQVKNTINVYKDSLENIESFINNNSHEGMHYGFIFDGQSVECSNIWYTYTGSKLQLIARNAAMNKSGYFLDVCNKQNIICELTYLVSKILEKEGIRIAFSIAWLSEVGEDLRMDADKRRKLCSENEEICSQIAYYRKLCNENNIEIDVALRKKIYYEEPKEILRLLKNKVEENLL